MSTIVLRNPCNTVSQLRYLTGTCRSPVVCDDGSARGRGLACSYQSIILHTAAWERALYRAGIGQPLPNYSAAEHTEHDAADRFQHGIRPIWPSGNRPISHSSLGQGMRTVWTLRIRNVFIEIYTIRSFREQKTSSGENWNGCKIKKWLRGWWWYRKWGRRLRHLSYSLYSSFHSRLPILWC